jgi:hypothetical protein
MTGQGIPNMGRSVQDWRRQTQGNLRRLGPILLKIFEENRPRLRRWDQQLTDWVRSRRWGVDPSLPKVAIYVLGAVVILAIPLLTFVALGAFLTFLGVQIVQKWSQGDPARQTQRRYLRSADADDDDFDLD